MSTPITISTKPTAAQAEAVIAAGPGATVHHPLASYAGRKRQLEQGLGRAGVPHRLVRTLGWSVTGRAAPVAESVGQTNADASAEITLVDGNVEGSA